MDRYDDDNDVEDDDNDRDDDDNDRDAVKARTSRQKIHK